LLWLVRQVLIRIFGMPPFSRFVIKKIISASGARLCLILAFANFISISSFSQAPTPEIHSSSNFDAETEIARPIRHDIFSNTYQSRYAPTSVFWMPVATYILPGLSQFQNEQNVAGLTYGSMAVTGLATLITASSALERSNGGGVNTSDLTTDSNTLRRLIWGAKLYELSGELSVFQSFRSAVRDNRQDGKNTSYSFLPEKETTADLLQAPFQFSHFLKPSTFIPLGVALGIVTGLRQNPRFGLNPSYLTFSSSISYAAGVGEEAMFRGWMQPLFYEQFNSKFWANTSTSLIFAAAHISAENPIPLPQFILGGYLGWLVDSGGWSLSQSIFVHTWWDIIVFVSEMKTAPANAAIYLPLYQSSF
jgi:membrane protease YdiL (CAAX protease family)